MVAYAALLSLLQLLDSILHPATTQTRIYHNRAQLKSLREQVSFLLDFLENSEKQDLRLASVEAKIRDAAYRAKDVLEYDICNQIREEAIFRYDLVVLPFLFVFTSPLLYLVLESMGDSILVLAPIMHYFLILLKSLLPISFQPVLFVSARVIIPFMVHILKPLIYISVVVVCYGGLSVELINSKSIKGTSFAKYWLSASQPENQDLRMAIDDFSFILNEVIKSNNASSSGQNSQSGACADVVSRWDFRGMGKNLVVGLDSELEEIHGHLLGHQPELQIVSIVGMGGIGKTTLARQVYDDPHIVYHFDKCAWVTISQKYSLRHAMLGLLDSAKISTKEVVQNHREDDLDQKLGEHLHKNLVSRRYLIVMDDVWDTNVWDFMRMFFPDNNNGSRVLLTTRLSEVASYANCGSPSIHMRFLNHCDSWNLLHDKVFGEESCPPELEAIGRTIAENCGGLPLAIVVVSGLLYNEHRTERDWTQVSGNIISILRKDDEQYMEILGLSYNHLPHHLKPCFLYMGSFREDEEISVPRLFNLWAAEGFLKPCTTKSLEEVAEDYLKDLIQRSLVLVCKWSCDGRIKTCKIHDLIRDFCCLNAWNEKFIYFGNRNWIFGEAESWERLWTLFDNGNDSQRASSYVMAHSYLYCGKAYDYVSSIYLDFRLLRVLDVAASTLHEFPYEIFKLVHLRYLGVTYNYYSLPPSILLLWNLQTIVYHGTRFGSSLWIPVEIWSLPHLRHLYFVGDMLPDPPSRNSPVLENLQTLVGISNFRCTERILRRIPNLKKLGISYHDSIPVEGYLESLVNLRHLENLKITMKYGFATSEPRLAFPQKIKKLTLSGCRISWESLRIVGALPNLQVLKLRNHACRGRIWEPVEGEFCELKVLEVEDTDVEQWRANEWHFPRLRHLSIKRLYKLEEIPCEMGEIATLEMIELVDCLPSAVASAKQMQEEQLSMGNECLKIHLETSF